MPGKPGREGEPMNKAWSVVAVCGALLCTLVVGCGRGTPPATEGADPSVEPAAPSSTPPAHPTSVLMPGPLPAAVAKALDAAIKAVYYSPASPTAAALRNMAMFRGAKPTDYLEFEFAPLSLAAGSASGAVGPNGLSAGSPEFSYSGDSGEVVVRNDVWTNGQTAVVTSTSSAARPGGRYEAQVLNYPEGPLRPVAPDRLQVRGRGDGSDIKILNLEELVFEAKEDTVLADTIIPRGTRLARENGAWVLKNPPFGQ